MEVDQVGEALVDRDRPAAQATRPAPRGIRRTARRRGGPPAQRPWPSPPRARRVVAVELGDPDARRERRRSIGGLRRRPPRTRRPGRAACRTRRPRTARPRSRIASCWAASTCVATSPVRLGEGQPEPGQLRVDQHVVGVHGSDDRVAGGGVAGLQPHLRADGQEVDQRCHRVLPEALVRSGRDDPAQRHGGRRAVLLDLDRAPVEHTRRRWRRQARRRHRSRPASPRRPARPRRS